MKYLLIFALLILSGCMAGQIKEETANENQVSVYKNSYMTTYDTFKTASDHCMKFNKIAKLEREASAFDLWMQDDYLCVIP